MQALLFLEQVGAGFRTFFVSDLLLHLMKRIVNVEKRKFVFVIYRVEMDEMDAWTDEPMDEQMDERMDERMDE